MRAPVLSLLALTACNPGKFDELVQSGRSAAMDASTPDARELDASLRVDARHDAAAREADSSALDGSIEDAATPVVDPCAQQHALAPFGVEDGGVVSAGSIAQSAKVAPRWPTDTIKIGDSVWWLFGFAFKPSSLVIATTESITSASSATPYVLSEAAGSAPAPASFVPPVAADSSLVFGEQLVHLPGNLLMDGRNDALLFYSPQALSGGSAGFMSRHIGTRIANVHIENGQVTTTTNSTLVFGPDKPPFRFGMLDDDGYLYLYGCVTPFYGVFNCMVARAPREEVAQGASYQFRTSNGWSSDFSAAAIVLDAARDELSISYNPYLKQYLAVHMHGYSPELIVRTSATPYGPWSTLTSIALPPPEGGQRAHYGGIEQPELASECGRKLVLTYLFGRGGNDSELRRIEVRLQ